MDLNLEEIIMLTAAIISLLLLLFAVNWRYFRDWTVVFLFKSLLSLIWGSVVVELHLIEYPSRLFAHYFDTSLLFELWVFPTLGVVYNQITKEQGLWPILYYAVLFSAGITAIEYPLEKYTALIKYLDWSWVTTFLTLLITFLSSRVFIAFYRWSCGYFSHR